VTAPVPIGAHETNETLQVWRPELVEDDAGGSSPVLVRMDDVRAKVSQPAAAEQIEAQQAGSTMTMIVHMKPSVDVRRGDELRRDDGDKLRVKYTIHPSERVYLRADCELIQPEGRRE
jgi:head-tail adaptor